MNHFTRYIIPFKISNNTQRIFSKIQNLLFTVFCLDLISDTESDGGDVFDDINSDEDEDNSNEDDYVYCTSVALSPIKLPVLEPVADVLEKHKQQQKQQQLMKENQPTDSGIYTHIFSSTKIYLL